MNNYPNQKGSRIEQLLNCKKKEDKGPQLFREQHPSEYQFINIDALKNKYQAPVQMPDLNQLQANPLDKQLMKPKFELNKCLPEVQLIITPSPSNNQPKKIQTHLENFITPKCPERPQFMHQNKEGKYEFKQNQNSNKVQKQEQKSQIIDLTNLSQDEIRKHLNIQNNNGNKKQETSAQKLADRAKLMRDPKFLKQGELQLQKLLNEDGVENQVIQIAKRDANAESKRFLNYKQMFETNQGQFAQNGKPLFEFNRLLRYLFLKDYIEDTRDDEFKVIPNNFQSNEEYCKIFEYLFLNECTAQIKQEIEAFINKAQTKYRRLQVKYDDNNADKDGTILAIRPFQEKELNDLFDDEKQEIKVDSDDDIPQQRDNNCDLIQLKNFIVIISRKFKFTLQDLCSKDHQAFFGMLVDPHKYENINSIKLQTFVDKSKLPSDWFNVVLFPFSKITTIIREYHMITNLGNSSLGQIILNPMNQWHMIAQDGEFDKQNIVSNSQLLNPFFNQIQNNFNPSQFKSIKEITLQKEGISLLQGPPGTGKTHTLLGLLSAVYEYMTLLHRFPKRKILICAPSNAAIDEIIIRIINGGIVDSHGQSRKDVQIVRLGVLDEENENSEIIKNVSIEDMAQRQLLNKKEFQVIGDQRTSGDIRIQITKLQKQIINLEKKIKIPGTLGEEQRQIKAQLDELYSQKRQQQGYIVDLKQGKRNFKESYQDYIDKILQKAEIICSTLSTSGSDKLMRFADQFDILIVDEAAQSTEPSNIIPLRLGINKMVLIGDPKQLPATTFSPISSQTLYNRSLFERILDNGFQPYFLNIQYRMHREIRQFPSQHFYQDKLCDDENNSNRITLHDYFRQRVLLIDVKDSKEQRQGYSYINNEECEVILQLSKFIRENFTTQSLGIICAYKAQVKMVKKQLKNRLGDDYNTKFISINTVDSFQGQEKDIILFSTVRSSQGGYIGFLSDARRMNVALTRARECVFLISNALTLCNNNLWRSLLRDYKKRGYYRCTLSTNPIIAQQIQTDQWNQQDREMSEQILKKLDKKDNENQQRETFNLKDFESNIQAPYYEDESTKKENSVIPKQANQQITEHQNQKQNQIIEKQYKVEKRLHNQQQEIKQPQNGEQIKIRIGNNKHHEKQQKQNEKEKQKEKELPQEQKESSYFDDLLSDVGIY